MTMNLKQWCESNWFILKDKIDFEVDRYWDWLISITTLLKIIRDPVFEIVLDKYWEQCKQAAKEWTKVHKEAEDFFQAWSWVTTMNPNLIKFHSLYNVKPIYHEKLFIVWKIRWSVDLVWEIDYWEYKWTYNIDYKNSKVHSPKYLMQLAWYKWLNWFNWILVYWKDKLKVVHYNWELDEIWQELVDYFLTLLEWNKQQ